MYLSYVSPQQYIMSSLFWWKTFILMSKATRRLKKSVKLNICNVIKKKIFQYFTVLFSDQRLLVYLWMCVIHVLLFKSLSIYSYKLWIFRYRQCCSAKAGFDSIKMAVQAHRRVPKHFFFEQPTSCSGTFSLSLFLSPLVTAVVVRSQPVPTSNNHIPGKSSTCSII